MLSTLEKTIVLKGTDLFKDIAAEEIYNVAQVTEEERLDSGKLLFNQGDAGDSLYIIVTGQIRIHVGEKEVTKLDKGASFGEMALVDDEPRSASATAIDETILLKIGQENFYDVMASSTAVMRGVLKGLTGIIRRLTDRVHTS